MTPRRDENVSTKGAAPLVISPVVIQDVHDGDTFRAHLPMAVLLDQLEGEWEERIRLAHVNAAELHAPGGLEAREALRGWVVEHALGDTGGGGFTLLCWGRDQYGRLVADLRGRDGCLASEHMAVQPGSVPMEVRRQLGGARGQAST